MKNLKKLNRKELLLIGGGDTAYAFCDQDGNCPAAHGNTYCSDGICYRTNPGGPGGGSDGCNEPQHLCSPWETGCGCVYM